MTQAQERALVQTGPQAMSMPETNWGEVERIFRGMIARNTSDAVVDATIMVCRELGLNPVLKQVDLIDGQVYVNHKGLLTIAHRSGLFDGIEVLEEGETDTHWTARVALYRKDMTHAFTYRGRYPKSGRNKQYGAEMALTRAETHALRRAFNVSMPVYEEINWRDEGAIEARATQTVREVPPARLAAPVEAPTAAGPGLPHDEFADLLASLQQMDADGLATKAIVEFADAQWETLDADQQARVLDDLRRIKRARKAATANRAPAQAPVAPIEAEVVAETPAASGLTWTELWQWARQHGFADRAALDTFLGRPTQGMTAAAIHAEMLANMPTEQEVADWDRAAQDDAQGPPAEPFAGDKPASYAG